MRMSVTGVVSSGANSFLREYGRSMGWVDFVLLSFCNLLNTSISSIFGGFWAGRKAGRTEVSRGRYSCEIACFFLSF